MCTQSGPTLWSQMQPVCSRRLMITSVAGPRVQQVSDSRWEIRPRIACHLKRGSALLESGLKREKRRNL